MPNRVGDGTEDDSIYDRILKDERLMNQFSLFGDGIREVKKREGEEEQRRIIEDGLTYIDNLRIFEKIDNFIQDSGAYENKIPIRLDFGRNRKNIPPLESKEILRAIEILNKELRDKLGSEGLNSGIFPEIGEGVNNEARDYMRENFGQNMFILFESLRHSPEMGDKIKDYLVGRDSDGVRKTEKYRIDLQRAKAQRDLTPTEEKYIESVEELSKFNPFLVALLREARQESYEFLCHHFDSLSDRTWENISDRSYVPQLQVGTGPEGLSYFSEQTRRNPSVSTNTLVVDLGDQPGGPFALPQGDAWRLNSSNNVGNTIYNLPDFQSEYSLQQSVRGFSSPFKWYPGERTLQNLDVRRGSINIASDFSPTPDMISDSKYATNQDAQLVFAAQAAVLMKNVCMSTEFISAKPSGKTSGKGSEEVILRRTFCDGRVEEKTIYTDKIINSTGLGKPGYGFKLKGSQAGDILKDEDDINGFPRISNFLESFKLLSSNRLRIQPPETITIGGLGDSGAILIEVLAGLFKSKNPLIRNVKKIYIITDGELNNRPRYAAIQDVLPRGGRNNIVEIVPGRVGDIGYTDTTEKDKLGVYDNQGKRVKTLSGEYLRTDVYISATGLKQDIDDAYKGYFLEGSEVRRLAVALPTNSQVIVGEILEGRDNIIFTGTCAAPSFTFAKRIQLPVSSKQALDRVGAENAVAIGFVSQDSQANARINTSKNPSKKQVDSTDVQKQVLNLEGQIKKWIVPGIEDDNFNGIKDMEDVIDFVMGIINYDLVNSGISIQKAYNLCLDISLNEEGGLLVKVFNKKGGISEELQDIFTKILGKPRVQSYMKGLLIKYKSRKKGFRLHLKTLKSGRLSFKDTYLELV